MTEQAEQTARIERAINAARPIALNTTLHERLFVAVALVDKRAPTVADCIDILRQRSRRIWRQDEPARELISWVASGTTGNLDALSETVGVAHTPDMLTHWVMTGEGCPMFDALAVARRYGDNPDDENLVALISAAERLKIYNTSRARSSAPVSHP